MTLDDFLRHCAQDCVDGGSGHTGWEQLRDEREAMAEERKRLTRQPNLPCPQCGFDLLPSHVDARPCLCDWGVHRPTILLLTSERDEAREMLRQYELVMTQEDAEIVRDVQRLEQQRDEARADAHRAWEEATAARADGARLIVEATMPLVALLREWRDLDPLGAPPTEDLLDRTDAELEGMNADRLAAALKGEPSA